ncbi:MAG: GNAT family N-acetyltransferase [Streptococcaceae bacterium]|jgi:diamine N-acetyltransferase|nr:GNAT family N-acetyltransferase [Streptococcaceae bacterium]MCH4176303.1 GNAT family N-acetyltransferase [Streptococcaceae bacterium]
MKIRALERSDLRYIHEINNQRETMAYWFEEPYESLDELTSLYDKHIHDTHERRFVIEIDNQFAGVVELMWIDYIHRNCEIQIVVIKDFRGQGLASKALLKGIEYAFSILNMHKVYLYVDTTNAVAVHIYQKIGFEIEGTLKEQFFANGKYKDSFFMGFSRSHYEALRNNNI